MPSLVSIIIPTKNWRDYLKRALNGPKARTSPMEQWELLLIDNASKESLAVPLNTRSESLVR